MYFSIIFFSIFHNNLIRKLYVHKTIIHCARFCASLDKHCARLPVNLDEEQMHFLSGRFAAFRLHRVGWYNMCNAVYHCGLYYNSDYLFQLFCTLRFTKSHDKTGSIFPHEVFSCGMYT